MGINIGVVDKILLNFKNTAGLLSNILWTKLFTVIFLALSCLRTKVVKEENITWSKIYIFLFFGYIFFFLNWWILALPLPLVANIAIYIFTMTIGYILLLMTGLWMSRLLKSNLMDDVFNNESENFMQEIRLMENEYSVNLPTRFITRRYGMMVGSTLSIPFEHLLYWGHLHLENPTLLSTITLNNRLAKDFHSTTTIISFLIFQKLFTTRC